MSEEPELETEISTSDRDHIVIRGHDLTADIMGEMDFTSFVYLHLTGELPTTSEQRMLNAVLVSIAEHGVTPSVMASRLTLDAAPESLQGAVSSGLLGAGSVFLGSMEDCAKALQSATPYSDSTDAATALLDEAEGNFPGLGHPEHKPDDPRSVRLFEIADAEGVRGEHVELMQSVRSVAEQRYDRVLPINATGAIAAITSDMELDWRFVKGFALISRTAGLVGHLAEEQESPMARDIWDVVSEHVVYTGSEPSDESQ